MAPDRMSIGEDADADEMWQVQVEALDLGVRIARGEEPLRRSATLPWHTYYKGGQRVMLGSTLREIIEWVGQSALVEVRSKDFPGEIALRFADMDAARASRLEENLELSRNIDAWWERMEASFDKPVD